MIAATYSELKILIACLTWLFFSLRSLYNAALQAVVISSNVYFLHKPNNMHANIRYYIQYYIVTSLHVKSRLHLCCGRFVVTKYFRFKCTYFHTSRNILSIVIHINFIKLKIIIKIINKLWMKYIFFRKVEIYNVILYFGLIIIVLTSIVSQNVSCVQKQA